MSAVIAHSFEVADGTHNFSGFEVFLGCQRLGIDFNQIVGNLGLSFIKEFFIPLQLIQFGSIKFLEEVSHNTEVFKYSVAHFNGNLTGGIQSDRGSFQ